ncbi:MAG: TadE family type IV pilus minor pilin [Kineosporiaceae bacterium]
MTFVRGQQGSVTAELAVALPALVLVIATVTGAGAVARATARCHDAAWTGARLLARDEAPTQARATAARAAPPGAEIQHAVSGGEVTVLVSAEVQLGAGDIGRLPVRCRATAPLENPEGGS